MKMTHLPNELWLAIIIRCESPKDVWLALRNVNRQLRACVEQYFADEVVPELVVGLPMILPTYDARNPIRAEAVFIYCQDQSGQGRLRGDQDRVYFDLGETGPQFYLDHFLGRWAGMKDVDGGWLRPSVNWNLKLHGQEVSTRLKDACAVKEGVADGEARIQFNWKPTLTGYFR